MAKAKTTQDFMDEKKQSAIAQIEKLFDLSAFIHLESERLLKEALEKNNRGEEVTEAELAVIKVYQDLAMRA